MKKSKLVAATAMVSITGLAGSALAALPANAATHSSPRSLATVLTSDGNKFDKNGKDFDVVTEAVLAVLAAKPDSAVKVLADPSVKLTAFIPTDKAFLKLASDLTGKKVTSEKKAFTTVAGLGIDTVETVLLYHVVAWSKINAKAAFTGDVWQWHQDYGTWKRDDGMPEPRAMNIAIFLDEVMPINGPLMLVPKSQHAATALVPGDRLEIVVAVGGG